MQRWWLVHAEVDRGGVCVCVCVCMCDVYGYGWVVWCGRTTYELARLGFLLESRRKEESVCEEGGIVSRALIVGH
jgi:hypothetical protein